MKRFFLLCSILSICLCMPTIGARDAAVGKSYITGIVIDGCTSKPVPNLTIYSDTVGTARAVTNKKGVFKYPVVPGEDVVHILPFSTDIVGHSVFVSAREFKNKTVSIVVERGIKLKVRVRDEQGKPITQATVVPGSGARGKTDGKGVVVVGKCSRFRDGRLTVSAPGFKTWHKDELYAPLYAAEGITVTLVRETPEAPPTTDPQTKE